MISVTSASRYQSRSLMYIRGLNSWNCARQFRLTTDHPKAPQYRDTERRQPHNIKTQLKSRIQLSLPQQDGYKINTAIKIYSIKQRPITKPQQVGTTAHDELINNLVIAFYEQQSKSIGWGGVRALVEKYITCQIVAFDFDVDK